MPNDFGDLLDLGNLLELIKPALVEMVCEGFAVGFQVVATKRDTAEFASVGTTGLTFSWDNGRELRWRAFMPDGTVHCGRTLADVARMAGAL